MTTPSAPYQPYQPVPMRLDSGANKSTGVAYLLLLLLGFFGAHKFYLRRPGMGVAYIFTLGFFMIGLFVDLFTLPSQVRRVNTIG